MPAISTIVKLLLSLLAGVGITVFADKYLPGKVQNYEPISPGLKLGKKLAIFLGAMGLGGLAWNYVNRKFHILTPRHARKRSRTRRRRR